MYHDDVGEGPANTCVTYCLGTTLFALILIGIASGWITAERTYRNIIESFAEVKDKVVALNEAKNHQIVHFQAANFDANVSDLAFGVELHGALKLSRQTEYCQWEEISTTGEDDQNRTYTEYSYEKRWRGNRISSRFFDQSAAHHNPQRDPFPSETFTASVARAVTEDGIEALVEREVLMQTRASWRSVDWTLDALPSRSRSWWSGRDQTRYEAIAQLSGAETSLAARMGSFVYVGQGGYFFSPHTTTAAGAMFKYFMQYLEGSLLDWQLGDLMPSCTAGDIRVSYSVQDPEEISVVGEAGGSPAGYRISVYTTPKGHEIGMVHAGIISLEDMMDTEVNRQRLWCLLARTLLILPFGIITSFFNMEWFAAIGPWACSVAGLWVALWGLDVYAKALLAFSLGMLAITCIRYQKMELEGMTKAE